MSWAEEDWTVGLPGRVLHKVKELQVQQDRLSRENKQRQLQLDNSQDALNKQKIKHDEVRRELQILQRELKMVQDEAQTQTTTVERLSLDLQTKQTLVCSLEGQLDAARTLTQNLTLEVKRLEAELEKLQTSQEASLFSTPCWNTTSPWEQNAGKPEDRTGRRGDGDGRAVHVRQQLQFSDTPTAASSPWQGNRGAPHQRPPPDQSETFSNPGAAFPWERDNSRSPGQGRSRAAAAAPQAPPLTGPPGGGPPQQRDCEKTENLSKEADACVSELRSRVGALEGELRAETDRLKAGQEQLGRSRKELAAAETQLQKSRDQISLAQARTLQESDRASVAEQKAKKLQEELRCERQNADSCRLQHQQRTKELEKQHQMDVLELQKERQRQERQHQEEVTKLNQELQQARVQHNTLQAQAEKLSLQKQALEREVETLKAKLRWTEGQLQESEKKDAQTQAKLTEALREAQGVAASLEQSTRRGKSLEEEGRRVTQERDDALRLLKELKEQQASLAQPAAPQLHCSLGQSFSPTEPRPSGPSKNPPGEPQRRPAGREQGRGRLATPGYPTDREPGEGLDAEQMTTADPKRPPGGGKPADHEVVAAPNSSGTRAPAPAEAWPPRGQGGDAAALRKENEALSSDLRDAREEVQRRLEDLEALRRAEAEARSRLKQLSKKRAGREAELEEQERGRKAELERERAETERLKKALVSLRAQLGSEEKRAEEEAQREQGQEDREEELMELNIQMKAQLSEARAQLALEREERQREEEEKEERRKSVGTGVDVEKEKVSLSLRLAELEAELEDLRRRGGKEDDCPLTDLALGYDDKLNANVAALLPGLHNNRHLLPATEQSRRLLLCNTANQLNASQLILTEDQRAELFKLPLLPSGGASPMEESSPELGDATAGELSGAPSRPGTPDLGREVERLREEKTRMAQRADQCQAKLEALQSQVTVQTQQLTTAFDLQSRHIAGLLAELQHKGSALLSQGGELQRCRGELALLQARAAEGNPETAPVRTDPGAGGGSEFRRAGPPSESPSRDTVPPGEQDQTCHQRTGSEAAAPPSRVLQGAHACTPDTLPPAHPLLLCGAPAPGHEGVAGTEAQGPSSSSSSEVLPASGGLVRVHPAASESDPGAKMEPCANVPPRAPEEERKRLEAGPVSGRSKGPQEEPQEEVSVIRGDGVNREDVGADQKERVSLDQVSHLEQQVVALQARLRTVLEDKEKQAEELVLWRLSSQSPPASRLREQSLGLDDPTLNGVEPDRRDPSLGPAEQEERPDVLQGRGPLTVIREDRLILSCSSGKLQGTMLISRLQHSELTEPKSLLDVEKTFAPQNADDLIDDEGSDKENTDTNHSPAATTKPPPPPPPAVSQRASGDQHRGPRDAARGPPQTRGTQLSEDPAARATPATTQREVGGRPSFRSAATQTSASPPTPAPAPGPALLHHAGTQIQEEALVEEMAVAGAAEEAADASVGAAGRASLFAGSFPIPADPARLAERIRRNRSQLSAAFDDTEYEPYGLPEVVMKGFADIPSGPSCPYIVRRGLLGTPAVPVPQTDTPSAEETD